MRELAVQSMNGTNGTDDRIALDTEFQELAAEVTRVTTGTDFNGLKILGGDAGALAFQVGAGTSTEDTITVTTTDMSADTDITAVTGGDILDTINSKAAIDDIDAALSKVNTERTIYGATQNRFESVVSNLQTSVESQSAARSRIMDADFASETANLTRGQILQQAGTAMLAQANSLPNGVLSLLRG
jgi:flagellin